MPDKTQKEMTQELYQAVIGLPENPEENGLIGDVKELVKVIKEQNGRIRKNSKLIYIGYGVFIAIAIALGANWIFFGG